VQDMGPIFTRGCARHQAFHTTKPNGLGIGLSIYRSIIKAHGGRLWAVRGMPKGATFILTLLQSGSLSLKTNAIRAVPMYSRRQLLR
jgi:signal transduction histidine kinase